MDTRRAEVAQEIPESSGPSSTDGKACFRRIEEVQIGDPKHIHGTFRFFMTNPRRLFFADRAHSFTPVGQPDHAHLAARRNGLGDGTAALQHIIIEVWHHHGHAFGGQECTVWTIQLRLQLLQGALVVERCREVMPVLMRITTIWAEVGWRSCARSKQA